MAGLCGHRIGWRQAGNNRLNTDWAVMALGYIFLLATFGIYLRSSTGKGWNILLAMRVNIILIFTFVSKFLRILNYTECLFKSNPKFLNTKLHQTYPSGVSK